MLNSDKYRIIHLAEQLIDELGECENESFKNAIIRAITDGNINALSVITGVV